MQDNKDILASINTVQYRPSAHTQMSSSRHPETKHLSTPTIRIQRASPDLIPESKSADCKKNASSSTSSIITTRRTQSFPVQTSPIDPDLHRHKLDRKRSATEANLPNGEDTKEMDPASPDGDLNCSPKPEKGCSASPPSKKSRSCPKDLDWSDVTDPEQRRRIQNRIAQRKFREKAKETREKAERDAQNREMAGNSYRIPLASDINTAPEPLGLPWGSLNLTHVLSRGHEAEERRSSGRGTYNGGDILGPRILANTYGDQEVTPTTSYGSSIADDGIYDEALPFVYDPNLLPPYN